MFDKNKIWKNIETELFPEVEPFQVIGKIFLLHILSTLIVLGFCPQFGFSFLELLGLSQLIDITHYFMIVSHSFCQVACGLTLFLFSSTVIYTQLKLTEKEWLKNQKYIVFFLLISLTGGFFVAVAPDITFTNMVLWVLGSALSLFTHRLFKIFIFHRQ